MFLSCTKWNNTWQKFRKNIKKTTRKIEKNDLVKQYKKIITINSKSRIRHL